MALACLWYEGHGPGGYRFRADVGSNVYYSYVIGHDSYSTADELHCIRDVSHISSVMGPVPDTANRIVRFTVPLRHIDRDNRRIQFFSFRTPDAQGPALSKILSMPVFSTTGGKDEHIFHEDLTMENSYSTHSITTSFSHVEAPLTSAMFLGAIMNMLPSILPGASKMISGLFSGAVPSNAPAPDATAGSTLPPGINDLLQQLLKLIPGSQAKSLTTVKGFAPMQYTTAQIAPALLAAMPALTELLKNVLTPETMKSLIESVSPAKLTGTVLNSVSDTIKSVLGDDKEEMAHLERLHKVTGPPLDDLLKTLSIGASIADDTNVYKRVGAVSLNFENVRTQRIGNKSMPIFTSDKGISFPLSFSTPRNIRRAELVCLLKDPVTLKIAARYDKELHDVSSGPLPAAPEFGADALGRLISNADYLVSAQIMWRNNKGKRRGTSRIHFIRLIKSATYDTITGAGPVISLDDPERYAAFRHKIWEGSPHSDDREFQVKVHYTFVLDRSLYGVGKEKSLVKRENQNRGTRLIKIKSGIALSLESLNTIMQPLSETDLDALKSPDFIEQASRAGKTSLTFSASSTARYQLWVYPEISQQSIVLRSAEEADDHGQVTRMSEKIVHFPQVVSAWLICMEFGKTGESVSSGKIIAKTPMPLHAIDAIKVVFQERNTKNGSRK